MCLSGPKTQLVQPGDTIDLVLEGFFSEAYYDLAFFMPSILGDGARPCGPGLETRDIHLKKSSNGTINKALPRLSAGGLSALIWQDVQVESSAHGSYSICLCDYSYYLADDPVCTRAEHYSLHAGWLHVKGEAGPANSPADVVYVQRSRDNAYPVHHSSALQHLSMYAPHASA